MKSSFGNNLELIVFGESHKKSIGATLIGIPSGIKIDETFIKKQLLLRSSSFIFTTERKESDEFEIISGIFKGYTTGTPLTTILKNRDIENSSYEDIKNIARPGHSDYTNYIKYNGFNDMYGGGHSSGRLTAPIVAVCSILLQELLKKNIEIKTHIKQIYNIKDTPFSQNTEELKKQISQLDKSKFYVINHKIENDYLSYLNKIKNENDSASSILETAIIGARAGIGDPFFDSVESIISHLMFSIPGIKGVQFGKGFDSIEEKGSSFNDEYFIEDDIVKTKTNNSGGVNGGITNGMPIVFSLFVKPPSSIGIKQHSINFIEKKNVDLTIKGRHDAFIASRCIPVVNSLCAFAIFDMLISYFGYNYFR